METTYKADDNGDWHGVPYGLRYEHQPRTDVGHLINWRGTGRIFEVHVQHSRYGYTTISVRSSFGLSRFCDMVAEDVARDMGKRLDRGAGQGPFQGHGDTLSAETGCGRFEVRRTTID
jgi:hypothetical protein